MSDQTQQDFIKDRFERMYREGVTPWKEHGFPKLLDVFADRLTAAGKNPTVLDLGCGDGWISVGLAAAGAQVWGIDSSPTAIETAMQHAQEQGLSGRIQFTVGDALDPSVDKRSFDGIVDRGLFHHILPENRDRYFQRFNRASHPGTLVYLAVFSRKNEEGIGQRFDKKDIQGVFGGLFETLESEEDAFPVDAPAHLLYFILRRR